MDLALLITRTSFLVLDTLRRRSSSPCLYVLGDLIFFTALRPRKSDTETVASAPTAECSTHIGTLNAYKINTVSALEDIMRYTVTGDNLQFLNVELGAGEKLDVNDGSVAYFTGDMEIARKGGGLIGGLKKAITGGTLDLLTCGPSRGSGTLGLCGKLPGRMMDINVEGMGWIAQKDAYVASQPDVRIDKEMQKTLGDTFGAEGLVLMKFSGKGMIFLFSLGDFNIYSLQKGETYSVATDMAVAWETSVGYSVVLNKDLRSSRKDDGPYYTIFKGPGRIIVQSMTPSRMMDVFLPLIPATDGSA